MASTIVPSLAISFARALEPAAVNRMEAGLGTVWAHAVGSSFFFRWRELFASFPMSLLKSLYQPCLHELDPKLRLVEAMSALFPKKLQRDWTEMIWPGFIAPTESYHLVPYSERVSKDSSVDGFQNGSGRGAASQRSWRLRFAAVCEINLTWTKSNLLWRKLFACINSWKWLERRNFALPLVAKSWNLQLPWLSTSTRWTPYRWIRCHLNHVCLFDLILWLIAGQVTQFFQQLPPYIFAPQLLCICQDLDGFDLSDPQCRGCICCELWSNGTSPLQSCQ